MHCLIITANYQQTYFATLELLQKLEPTSSTLSLIKLLSPMPDIDILLEQVEKVNFVDSVDRFLHDTPFIPFFNPIVDVRVIATLLVVNA